MIEPTPEPAAPKASRASAGPVSFVLSLLGSLKFALALVIVITMACIAGTLIPQGEQVAQYLARNQDSHRVMHALAALGLTRVFYSWWFVALLFVLAASLLVCTVRRYAAIKRSKGAVRTRVVGSFITHVSLLLVLAGGVVRVLWGQKGLVAFHEGETVSVAESPNESFQLPFSVRLTDFTLEFHESPMAPPGTQADTLMVRWPERNLEAEFPVELRVAYPVVLPDAPRGAEPSFTVTVLRYVPDFAMDGPTGEVKSRSDQPNNPALLVSATDGVTTNSQWVFARFPDFGIHGGAAGSPPVPLTFLFKSGQAMAAMGRPQAPIKAFRSTLDVLDNGNVVRTVTVAVNSPFSYRGYTFYQSNYDPKDLTWSALQVVRDPGVPIVYSGFVLLMAGLTVVFCVGPWLDSQHDKGR